MRRIFLRVRYWIGPEIWDGLGGLILFAGVTIFFAYLHHHIDGFHHRFREFDPGRWWWPIHQAWKAVFG